MTAVIETAVWCEQNVQWSTKVKDYTVSFYDGQWHCTCPAHKYNKQKPCKHIKQVQDQKCTWGEGALWGSAEWEYPEGGKCPECGGPVTGVRIAV